MQVWFIQVSGVYFVHSGNLAIIFSRLIADGPVSYQYCVIGSLSALLYIYNDRMPANINHHHRSMQE